jgi:putative nucleotidyltransferase with HDIG domain
MDQQRILVVDDDAVVRQVVSRSLEYAGYTTVSASSAEQAMHMLHGGELCHLVMSDVTMPGTDGLELLDTLNREFPETPVVLLTARHDLHVATSAFRRGAFDYLLKPFQREDLISTAERALEHGLRKRQSVLYRHNLENAMSEQTQSLQATMLDLQRSYDVTLAAMGDALELRDREIEGHSRRVTAYSIALARALGVDPISVIVIARGAFLHDLGKLAVPDAILRKPGKLTAEEMEIMREHCRLGYDIVRKIPFLAEAAEIVYAHQEKFDGTGYPRQLRGDQIPLGARIFAIADALDAITSDRPYRQASTFEFAIDEIAACRGNQFDPHVVDAFLALPISLWREIQTEISQNCQYEDVFRRAAA